MSSPDFEMPADDNGDNTYMVTVKASDGTDMATHEVTIMVTDVDEVPTIAGDATIDYAENGTGDVATYTAMDPEEATITWSLSGTDAGVFDISGAGVLTFNESPDYEMPADADADNMYISDYPGHRRDHEYWPPPSKSRSRSPTWKRWPLEHVFA